MAGAEYGDALLAGKKVVPPLWLEKRTAAPSGAIEKSAGGGAFPGFGSQDPTSVLQECIYSCPACHDCFRWNWDSCRSWNQPRHEIAHFSRRGWLCGMIEARLRGFRINYTGSLGSASAKAQSVRGFHGLTFRWRGLFGPRLSYIVSSFSGIAFLGHMLYTKSVSRPRKGLLIFCFVVPKWCPTLQNHAVTGYANLFAVFEKMPISCGFEGCSYDTACRLMTSKMAILAIKNYPLFLDISLSFGKLKLS